MEHVGSEEACPRGPPSIQGYGLGTFGLYKTQRTLAGAVLMFTKLFFFTSSSMMA